MNDKLISSHSNKDRAPKFYEVHSSSKVSTEQKVTKAQFIYEISPLIYVFFPIPIMGKSTIENPHIFYSHFLNRC